MGLISFWWAGSRQQRTRPELTVTRHPELLILDPRRFTSEKLMKFEEIFQEFREQDFKPANEAYRDKVRQELDRKILVELLEFDQSIMENLEILREQWCHEPSVHGGKKTAPPRG